MHMATRSTICVHLGRMHACALYAAVQGEGVELKGDNQPFARVRA